MTGIRNAPYAHQHWIFVHGIMIGKYLLGYDLRSFLRLLLSPKLILRPDLLQFLGIVTEILASSVEPLPAAWQQVEAEAW